MQLRYIHANRIGPSVLNITEKKADFDRFKSPPMFINNFVCFQLRKRLIVHETNSHTLKKWPQ